VSTYVRRGDGVWLAIVQVFSHSRHRQYVVTVMTFASVSMALPPQNGHKLGRVIVSVILMSLFRLYGFFEANTSERDASLDVLLWTSSSQHNAGDWVAMSELQQIDEDGGSPDQPHEWDNQRGQGEWNGQHQENRRYQIGQQRQRSVTARRRTRDVDGVRWRRGTYLVQNSAIDGGHGLAHVVENPTVEDGSCRHKSLPKRTPSAIAMIAMTHFMATSRRRSASRPRSCHSLHRCASL